MGLAPHPVKGRKPHWRWGVAQTAVVGKPVTVEPDEHVKEATDRIMGAIAECVARAREIYPQHAAPGDDDWWARAPETAFVRSQEPVRVKVAVVGAGSWGTAVAALVAANAPTTLWARRPELAAHIDGAHENTDYLPGIALPESLRVDVGAGGRVHRRRRRRARCAVARVPRGARRRPAVHRTRRVL